MIANEEGKIIMKKHKKTIWVKKIFTIMILVCSLLATPMAASKGTYTIQSEESFGDKWEY